MVLLLFVLVNIGMVSADAIARLDAIETARAELLKYHISGMHHCIDNSGDTVESFRFEMWRDRDRIRYDYVLLPIVTDDPNVKQSFGKRAILGVNCAKPGFSVRYYEGTEVAVLPSNHKRLGQEYIANIDEDMVLLSSIGFDMNLTRINHSVEMCIAPGDNYTVLSKTSDRLSLSCKTRYLFRDYVFDNGTLASVTIRVANRNGGPEYVTTGTLGQAENKYALPRRVTYETVSGGKSYSTITQEFTYHSLNTPIDPAVFTLAGMKIPQGTLVDDGKFQDESKFLVDGKVIPFRKIPEDTRKSMFQRQPDVAAAPPVAVDAPYNHVWLYAIVCFILAAVGILMLRKVIRRG